MLRLSSRRRLAPIYRFVVCMFAFVLLLPGSFGGGELGAQNYPTKPIRIITAGVGGGNDIGARIIAQGIAGPLGQQVLVDNRAGGFPMGQAVFNAPADGYTLLYYNSSFWIGPLLQKGAGYDVEKDFAPVAGAVYMPLVLVVHPSVPVKSVKELIEYAKAHPGELNFSSGSAGSVSHIAGLVFADMAGVNIVNIRYKSSGQEASDLIGGHVQMSFGPPAEVMPKVKAGQLRALAVGCPEPSPLLPGLPTIASTVPGFTSGTTYGVWVKAKTPEPIIRRLNQEVVRYLKTPQAKDLFEKNGADIFASSPEELGTLVSSDLTTMKKLFKSTDILRVD